MTRLFEDQTQAAPAGYAQVALEQGIDVTADGLTYAVSAELADLSVGERVFVPLGRSNKEVAGYVVSLSEHLAGATSRSASMSSTLAGTSPTGFKGAGVAASRIKFIVRRDPHTITLTHDLVELARWISSYYCCPLGMVFVTMLPAAVKRGTGSTVRRVVQIAPTTDEAQPAEQTSTDADSAEAGGNAPRNRKLTKLQQAVLDTLRQRHEAGEAWVDSHELAHQAGAKTVTPVTQLIERGYLAASLLDEVRSGRARAMADPTPPASSCDNEAAGKTITPTAEQQAALEAITGAEGFGVDLLLGVTGSGKTEVYLRAIEHVHGRGFGAIVLVPEIALTPQTVGRFTERFGADHIAVLHSGLTASQRHQQWRRIRKGEAPIVIGARSAVFAPLPHLGLIIVDEEQETSYKQDQLPRYHARDVAIKRAHILGIHTVLGSATPSLESYYNTEPDRPHPYRLLRLPHRVTGQDLPRVHLVDLRQERRKRYEYSGKGGIHLLSIRLESALRRCLKEGGQAMLLLNRRGYANYISCPDHRCGWIMSCDYCDTLMVYHKDRALPQGGLVRCHHCSAEQELPLHCPDCGKKVSVFGLGTQRIEEEIGRKFPEATMLRMDSDVMKSGADYFDSLERFRRGDVQVMLGTQMIAKGLDFPSVRLVGVISGDTSLHMPDFRAAERTFQLIAQVAGRAGRGTEASEVIVQTFNPTEEAIILAAQHDYETFAQKELALRKQVNLPPVSRMARIVVRSRDHVEAAHDAAALARQLKQLITQLELPVQLRGPAPCPIARIAEYHRHQVEIIAPPPQPAARLQRVVTAARNAGLVRSDIRMAVDVDPIHLV